jgi:hypothetical protein
MASDALVISKLSERIGLNEHQIRRIYDKLYDLEGGINENTYEIINNKSEIITNVTAFDGDDMGTMADMEVDLTSLGDVIIAIFNRLNETRNVINALYTRVGALEANVSLLATVPIRTVLVMSDLQLHTVFTSDFVAYDYHHRLDLEQKFTRRGKVENNWDIIYNNNVGNQAGLKDMFTSNFIHTRIAPGRLNGVLTVLRQQDWSGASVATRLAGKGGSVIDGTSTVDFYDPSHTYQSATIEAMDHPTTDDGKYNDAPLTTQVLVESTISAVLTVGLAVTAIGAAFYVAGPVAATGANAIVKDIYVPLLIDLSNEIQTYAYKWVSQKLIVDSILQLHKTITTVPQMEFRRNDEKHIKDSKGRILSIVRQTTYSEHAFNGKHMGRQSAKANESPGVNGSTRSGYSNKTTTSRVHTKSSTYGAEFFGRIHYRHHSVTNVFDTTVGDQDWITRPKYKISLNIDINRDPTGSSAWKSGAYGNFDRAEGDAFALNGRLFAAYDYTLSQWVYYDKDGVWTPVP